MIESVVEEATLTWLKTLGYSVRFGAEIAPGEPGAERSDYAQVLLDGRLRNALAALNPDVPAAALDEALRIVTQPQHPSLIANNRAFHRMLVDGVEVECLRPDGSLAGDRVRLVDFEHPEANDWLAVSQFTVV